jgi:hypothetical protein
MAAPHDTVAALVSTLGFLVSANMCVFAPSLLVAQIAASVLNVQGHFRTTARSVHHESRWRCRDFQYGRTDATL